MHTKLAASILSADFAHLAFEVNAVIAAGVDAIHFDVMDHHYVPNLSFGPFVCTALRNANIAAYIDVHAMVTNPQDYIDDFAKAGANRFTFHPSTVSNVKDTCQQIKASGMQAGLAFNPDEDIDIPKSLFDLIDLVLIMSVYPGFSGQKFIPSALQKIEQAKQLLHHTNVHIGIDGGIKVDNIASVVKAGADFVVMGSGIFDASDYNNRVHTIRHALESAK